MLYVTFPDKETALELSELLLSNKLIACYNLYEMTSGFWWEQKIDREEEVTVVMKTITLHIPEIVETIEKHHPYDTPCIVHFPIQANEKYAMWVINNVK